MIKEDIDLLARTNQLEIDKMYLSKMDSELTQHHKDLERILSEIID
jgi:hypothetical protein